MNAIRRLLGWLVILGGLGAGECPAVVFVATNGVGYHVAAPTGEWRGSGWEQTAPIGSFLGTVFHSNAMLTAKHVGIATNTPFVYQGVSRTVTGVVDDAASDLTILRFTPPATNWAWINREPAADTSGWIVVQGRGLERGAVVTNLFGATNGWTWGAYSGIRRWGINRLDGFDDYQSSGDGVLAWANFDADAHPDECMLSNYDSGGPSFVRSGAGWKLTAISYSVFPSTFSLASNGAAPFTATLFDCSGLYFKAGSSWFYAVPTNFPQPCAFYASRVAQRLGWITNVVRTLTFPADVGLAWSGGGALGGAAAEGAVFLLTATNRGPYAVRDLAIDATWDAALRLQSVDLSAGAYAPETGRWSLPLLADGAGATLRAIVTVRRTQAVTGTNTAAVAAADLPDEYPADNTSSVGFTAPPTASLLLLW